MNGKLFFSIIIPTYNRADFILKTVDSVLTQRYQNFEIIIVDDGSTDNTSQVVASIADSRIQYFKIENSERAVARNIGMNKAKGDYITFLDSDDLLYPDYLSNAVESLAKFNYPYFFHLAYESKSAETGESIREYIVPNDNIYSLVRGNHLSCLGIFMKRETAGKFKFNEDRNLSGSEDWELWLRLAANCGLKTDYRISSALMVHNARSVFNYAENKLLQRKNLALKYAFEDQSVKNIFGKYKAAMEAYCDTYISLHLVLSKQNNKSIKYLIRAFYYYPLSLFDIRTLAIFKYFLLNIFGLRK